MNRQRLLSIALLAIVVALLGLRMRNWFVGEVGLLTPRATPDLAAYLDPARAALEGKNPYPLAIQGVFAIPGNSPLYLLFVTPLALINWDAAKTIWLLVNLAAVLGIVWILETRFRPDRDAPLNRARFIFITLLFLALAATSSVIQLGQTSLVVMLAMLAGLVLLPKNQIWAGLLFGFALSKYSLAFLLLPYLLIERRFLVLLIAAVSQGVGVLGIAWLVSESPVQVARDYIAMASVFASSITEYNLHSRLEEWGASASVARLIDLAGIGITVLVLAAYLLRKRLRTVEKDQALFIPFLFIGAIPFVYHRLYDGIVFIMLTNIWAWRKTMPFENKAGYNRLVIAVTLFVFAALLYPRPILNVSLALNNAVGFIPETLAALIAWLFLVVHLLLPPRQTTEPSNNDLKAIL